jgi:hypothetical protein
MLWNAKSKLLEEPFDREADLEDAILEVAPMLFGANRIYLDTKRKIGAKGKTRNIPDGYLIDLSSVRQPQLFVVENELSRHAPLKHVAVQILEFSLSFETTQHKVKSIVKDALVAEVDAFAKCEAYAKDHGFENVDVLLERMIYGEDRFKALVIIDSLDAELEEVLISRFQFPVEILTIERYRDEAGDRLYRFEPFLQDTTGPTEERAHSSNLPALDPADLDTIVVPARDDGFEEVFLGENRWCRIRMHSSMIPRIKYIAAYRVAPTSAITHLAPVSTIEPWPDSNKYVLNFAAPAEPIGPIALVEKGAVRAPQGPRNTSWERLTRAETLDEAF